ncbi:MAG TPA: hypothetical protein VF282_11650 [Bacillota bacterium]
MAGNDDRPRDDEPDREQGYGPRPPRETQPMGAYFQTEPHFRQPAVTAPFTNPNAAERAARALRRAGFEDVQVDRVSPYPSARGEMTDQAFPQSLTGQERVDQRFFSAVDPSVSGLSTDEPVGEEAYVLTVVLPDRDGAREEAVRILRDQGARLGIDRDRARSDRYDPQHADDAGGT